MRNANIILLVDNEDSTFQTGLDGLGLDIIVSIYCSRDENFNAKTFKASMVEDAALSAVAAHKVYNLLNSGEKKKCPSRKNARQRKKMQTSL